MSLWINSTLVVLLVFNMLSLTVRTSWMGFRLVLSSHSSVYRTSRNYCRTVYFSKSNDVFTNLALEDWFYRNTNFEKNNLLLLWINKPCVVIGRHQNPWAEVNFSQLSQHGIQFSRRNSGGGTVYHDNGNLNCTFFSTRLRYNRKQNLELICKALTKEWNLNVEVSPREDIILDQKYKISGTASKLGNKVAYHHCTLLINVDTSKLLQALDVTDVCSHHLCYIISFHWIFLLYLAGGFKQSHTKCKIQNKESFRRYSFNDSW